MVMAVQAEDHWAYVPPVMPALGADGHPVDQWLAKAQKERGIVPVGLAAPRDWVERAAYTLLGLPATAEQIRKIEARPDDATWRSIIDEMLASPAYGERWARHWMDVARYADTSGYAFEQDNRFPFAYTYRDWLVRAFNEDMYYPDFIRWQLAGDLITDRPDHPNIAALGFITVGPRSGPVETIDDRVDVVSRGFLATTVACARCHKHKTDPIVMEDYYSMYSIFENLEEPPEKPVIGKAADPAAEAAFLAEVANWEKQDEAVRQELVNHIRAPEHLAVYLSLAWIAKKEQWDHPKATSEAFKRGRYRPDGVLHWRDFLQGKAWDAKSSPRLSAWAAAMEQPDEAKRNALCQELAQEWTSAAEGSELAQLKTQGNCPLNYDVHRISALFDREDDTKRRERQSALSRLQADHDGSPPRAMVIKDKAQWQKAQIFLRGNPGTRGDFIDRQWLSFLGGEKFPEGKSPRLSLAEKIIDPANPLTDRVIVNRIWAWHFGQALVEPSDFGSQTPQPVLHELLDGLAILFRQRGSSFKELHRLLLTSRAYRLKADGAEKNRSIDEANELVWKWNRRRADFESMRDRVLATAGSLQAEQRGGRARKLEDPAMDARRSLYSFIDRYDMPTTLVSFDLPHPDHHSGKRVETIVPQQALYFLNGALVQRQAQSLSQSPGFVACADDAARVNWIYQQLYQRQPSESEAQRVLAWVREADAASYQAPLGGHWEIRHAPDQNGVLGAEQAFPMFEGNAWKTGADLSKAPIPWLSVGPGHGHPCQGHALIIRWRASGAGLVRMQGEISKPQDGGDVLAWEVYAKDQRKLSGGMLAPKQHQAINTEWVPVQAGEAIDFVYRAPNGQNNGGTHWQIRIIGKEHAEGDEREIGNFEKQFPRSSEVPAAPASVSPWADVIQMLWAANEFHFID